MEYIYELNIPLFEEIANLTPEVKNKFFPPIDTGQSPITLNKYYLNSANQILKPDFFNFLDIEWSSVILFHKTNGFKGPIHIDTDDLSKDIPWGINWITGGQCVMEYWVIDDLISRHASIYSHDNTKIINVMFYTPHPGKTPEKIYYLNPGKAYLVNASVPHSSTGFDLRSTISLRSESNYIWEEVVTKLQNYIIV